MQWCADIAQLPIKKSFIALASHSHTSFIVIYFLSMSFCVDAALTLFLTHSVAFLQLFFVHHLYCNGFYRIFRHRCFFSYSFLRFFLYLFTLFQPTLMETLVYAYTHSYARRHTQKMHTHTVWFPLSSLFSQNASTFTVHTHLFLLFFSYIFSSGLCMKRRVRCRE